MATSHRSVIVVGTEGVLRARFAQPYLEEGRSVYELVSSCMVEKLVETAPFAFGVVVWTDKDIFLSSVEDSVFRLLGCPREEAPIHFEHQYENTEFSC